MQAGMKVMFLSAVIAGVLVSGCKDNQSRRKAAQDAKDVAMVERMSREPFKPIVPMPIAETDVTRYGLDRASCAFRKPGEADPIFLGGSDEGFLRIGDDLKRFAAKQDSAQFPGNAKSGYIGLTSWIDISRQPDAGTDGSQTNWPARLVIHDSLERVAFMADGTMTCSPTSEPETGSERTD